MTRLIAFLIYPGFQLLDAAGPIAPFEIAARHVPGSYALRVVAAEPGLVSSSCEIALQAQPFTSARDVDTLIVAAGDGSRTAMHCTKTRRFIVRCAAQTRRTASVCSGSYLLAAAGLLDGKRATTHWSRAADFGREFPLIKVDADCIFVNDGCVWTSAGITAGIDLSLALIEDDLGEEVARRTLQAAIEAPTPHDDRLLWLWRLLEPQVRQRIESRIERRMREARLPERKTFEAFDFAFQPGLDRDLVMELATLRFIDQGRNVLLAGMSGTGKSHIAKALALSACVANRRVLYTTSADMLTRLNAGLADGTLTRTAIKPYVRAELLLIDEFGLEQVEREEAFRSGLMQNILLPCYNERRSTIITSKIPWENWGEYLDDHLEATAIIDRLLHHSCVIVINGPSYRDWVHRQETENSTKAK